MGPQIPVATTQPGLLGTYVEQIEASMTDSNQKPRPKPQPWQIKGDKARVFTQRGATNMTRAQQDRFEAERARVMLNFVHPDDRIIFLKNAPARPASGALPQAN